jgi:Kef-type K+ transport system membrane component KefB
MSLSASAHAWAGELPLFMFLGATLVVAVCFRRLAVAVGQPKVIGEIAAGLAIGALLAATNAWWGGTGAPAAGSLVPSLSLLGDFGLIFLVVNALLSDRAETPGTRSDGWRASWLTLANVLPAFVGTAWLAVWYARSHELGSPMAFIMLVAAACSISAVPVLARILAELGLVGSTVGRLTFQVACWSDVFGWMVVGAALSLHGRGEPVQFGMFRMGVIAALVLGLVAARAMVRRHLASAPQAGGMVLLIVLLVTASVTHMAGLHLVFGAFLVGSVFASERALARQWLSQTTWVTERLFCPVFFVVSGMNLLSAGTLSSAEMAWGSAFLATCVLTKLIPLFLASRLLGLAPRESALVAVLLNTRGLMELVILSVGLKAGIFTPVQYSIFVMVAVLTTVISMPLCRQALRRGPVTSLVLRPGG